MTALQELDLSMNQLTHLAKGLIGPLPNLTRLDLSANLFVDIPIGDIVASTSLSLIDLRMNRLTRFYDEFMPLIERANGSTRVLMEGNPVVCDCRLRPLRFWLSVQATDEPWDKVICSGPPLLSGKAVTVVEDASLNCNRLLNQQQQLQPGGIKYEVFKDVIFRDVTRSSPSTIDVTWFVLTREDVADFTVEVRGLLPESDQPDLVAPAVASRTLGYGLRSDRIDGIERHTPYAVCIRARDSLGYLRPWKPNQCQLVSNDSPGRLSSSFTAATYFLLVACAGFLFN
jgi:hypothetical protein